MTLAGPRIVSAEDLGHTTSGDQVTGVPRSVPPVVTLDGVSVTYPGGTQAIDGLTLSVGDGEILGVVGPSGCGKSSLLSLLSGMREPTSGEIKWGTHLPGAGDKAAQHLVSMVFQKDTLLPWLRVEQNVGLFRRFNKRRVSADFEEKVTSLLKLAGLEDFRRAYPYQLSGGMRRRVAFISAMAANPRLLLLDEPFSALDEPTRVAIHQDVTNIIRDAGTSVVLVTHDLAEAATLCDRIVVMTARPGKLAAEHHVSFGHDRDVLALRQDEQFLALYGALWHDLSIQISAAGDAR